MALAEEVLARFDAPGAFSRRGGRAAGDIRRRPRERPLFLSALNRGQRRRASRRSAGPRRGLDSVEQREGRERNGEQEGSQPVRA